MKHRNIYFFLVLLLGLFGTVSSCKKDKDPIIQAPVIDLNEVGSVNSKKATAGGDLHLEGDIVAEGLIARIDVEIHQEGGNFKIEKSYTEGLYIDVRNVTFHEHLDIPANAPIGDYHLHFTVTDKNGRSTTVEAKLAIEAPKVAYQLVFTEAEGEAHGNHFHDLVDKTGVSPVVVSFTADGTAISGGHLHLDPTDIYKIEFKEFDNGGTEVQGKYIASKAVADFYKVFLIGGDFVLNSTTTDETGAIFQPRELKYGDGSDVSGSGGIGTTGIISYFTIGHKNEGSAKNVAFVLRKFTAVETKATVTREHWNRDDYATAFAGTDEVKLSFEIHAEHDH